VRHQFGGIATGLDGVEVAHLFWNINHTDNLLVVAFLLSRLHPTAFATKLFGEFFTGGVGNKLARNLFHISGGAGGLKEGLALLGPLSTRPSPQLVPPDSSSPLL